MKSIKAMLIMFLALFIFLPTNTKAALTEIEFSSGAKYDEDTYVYTGTDGSNSAIVRKNIDGTVIWSKEIPNAEYVALTVTTDGYIVVAATDLIVKYDKDGNIVWSKDYAGKYQAIVYAENGGFVIAGQNTDGIVAKFDKDGNELAVGRLKGAHGASFRGLDSTDDGGYVVIGLTYSHDLGIRDTCTAVIAKFDKDFNLVWNTYWGGEGSDEFSGIATDKDGNYAAVGRTFSPEKVQFSTDGSSDAVIVKYDKNGNVLWEKIYGGSGNDRFKAINISDAGTLLVAGFSKSSGVATIGGYDSVLLEVNSSGDIIKEEIFGTDGDDETYGLVRMSDSIVILIGLYPNENEYFKDGSMVFKKSFNVVLDTTFEDGISISSNEAKVQDIVSIVIDEKLKDKVQVKIVRLDNAKDITSLVKYDNTNNTFEMPNYDVKVIVSEGITPPPTGDNVLNYMILAIVSMVAITSIMIFSKKKSKK